MFWTQPQQLEHFEHIITNESRSWYILHTTYINTYHVVGRRNNVCTSWHYSKMAIFSVMAWRIKIVTLMNFNPFRYSHKENDYFYELSWLLFKNLTMQKRLVDLAETEWSRLFSIQWSRFQWKTWQAAGKCSKTNVFCLLCLTLFPIITSNKFRTRTRHLNTVTAYPLVVTTTGHREVRNTTTNQ